MSSIIYGLALIFVVFLIYWYIQNERADAAAAKLGILATKSPSEFKPKKKKSKRWKP